MAQCCSIILIEATSSRSDLVHGQHGTSLQMLQAAPVIACCLCSYIYFVTFTPLLASSRTTDYKGEESSSLCLTFSWMSGWISYNVILKLCPEKLWQETARTKDDKKRSEKEIMHGKSVWPNARVIDMDWNCNECSWAPSCGSTDTLDILPFTYTSFCHQLL